MHIPSHSALSVTCTALCFKVCLIFLTLLLKAGEVWQAETYSSLASPVFSGTSGREFAIWSLLQVEVWWRWTCPCLHWKSWLSLVQHQFLQSWFEPFESCFIPGGPPSSSCQSWCQTPHIIDFSSLYRLVSFSFTDTLETLHGQGTKSHQE